MITHIDMIQEQENESGQEEVLQLKGMQHPHKMLCHMVWGAAQCCDACQVFCGTVSLKSTGLPGKIAPLQIFFRKREMFFSLVRQTKETCTASLET